MFCCLGKDEGSFVKKKLYNSLDAHKKWRTRDVEQTNLYSLS